MKSENTKLSDSDVNSQSTPSLSHSDKKPDSTPMLSYSGLTRISRSNKVANFFHLDTPVKPECDTMRTDASLKFYNDSLCAGRSMVELMKFAILVILN